MKVSIVVAVYNREQTISRTLLSIRNQTYKNVEIVLVDGLSTDNSLCLSKKYLTSHDVCISEPDLGIYDALNKGIVNSTGDIVCFLHSDDFYSSNFILEKIMNMFVDFNFDIIYGDVNFVNPGANKKITRRYNSPRLSKFNLSYGLMPAHTAFYCKKNIYNHVGLYDINYKIAADFNFFCKLSDYDNYSSFYIKEPIVCMQVGGISTSGLKNKLLLNKEVLFALDANNIKSNYFKLLFKYFYKLKEVLFK